MTETFACPDCGDEVTLLGAAPGREVQCARCGTWIEVPYLPRSGVWTRARFRNPRHRWIIPLAWTGVGVLALSIILFTAYRYVVTQSRGAREVTLRQFVRAADSAEKSARPDRALSEIEAALAYLQNAASPDAERLEELQRRRDALSVKEAERRVEISAQLDPKSAVGELLNLQKRARTDRALDGLSTAMSDALDAARRRQVIADLGTCRKAADERKPFDAIAIAESALAVADKLDAQTFRSAMTETESILGPILSQRGVAVVQIPGQFTLGSAESYAHGVTPRIVDALRKQGYAPRPTRGPAVALWDRFATLRLDYNATETQEALYLQSQNRISEIGVVFTLKKGSNIVWQGRISPRSQVPVPDLPAFVASRLAVSDRRSPEMERVLYDDAFFSLMAQLDQVLKGVTAP